VARESARELARVARELARKLAPELAEVTRRKEAVCKQDSAAVVKSHLLPEKICKISSRRVSASEKETAVFTRRQETRADEIAAGSW
jgi:hypothetical protein